jgi:hypothetical protein
MDDKGDFLFQSPLCSNLKKYNTFLTFIVIFSSPAFSKISSQETSFIDTTMPASIPPEIIADWKVSDSIGKKKPDYSSAIAKIKSGLPSRYASKIDTGSTKALYLRACHFRRVSRIEPFSGVIKKLLCARSSSGGGIFAGNFEDLNDDTAKINDTTERITGIGVGNFYKSGAALLLLNFDDYYPTAAPLLEDKTGLIRDPCVSFDGKRVIFAWSKDNNGYHVNEMEIDKPGEIRQLTFDLPRLTVSDYEPCYLPNGDIVFNSSRCVQGSPIVPNLVSNLFIMNKDGKYLRRLCFDQSPGYHPTVTSNGKIMFSRWEFMDRNSSTVFGVFTMNPDGSLQNEYFGNQLTWPAAFSNAAEIPGSGGKFLSIISNVHGMSVYQGDLVMVDPTKGRNTMKAIRLIAPKRENPDSGTAFLPTSKKFQDPYPLSEAWFLICNAETTSTAKLYLMDIDGNRELLAWDTNQSISQPFPVCARKAPRLACQADYSKTTGEVAMTNAYFGTGIDTTVKPGSIRKLRVIALDYRMYPYIGNNSHNLTPIALSEGSVESKRILGETKVESDGSAAIIVPARTPLYLQLIDSLGCVIQSMRSWMTLQPGERFDCYGCHEDKNNAPPPTGTAIARTPKALEPFYDLPGGYFHFPEVIQPILDAKCVSCHIEGHSSRLNLSGEKNWDSKAERFWCKSYVNLDALNVPGVGLKVINCISNQSPAEGLKPNTFGSGKSRIIAKLRARSGSMKDVSCTEEEIGKLCAWIDLCIPHGGKYTDDMKPEDAQFYNQRLLIRKQEEEFEAQNIQEFIQNGGYNNIKYGGSFSGVANQGKPPPIRGTVDGLNFRVRFSRLSRQLIMKLPSAGIVTLIDLKGRRILNFSVSKDEYLNGKGTACRAFTFSVTAGLYIVQFKGNRSGAEKVIPVL